MQGAYRAGRRQYAHGEVTGMAWALGQGLERGLLPAMEAASAALNRVVWGPPLLALLLAVALLAALGKFTRPDRTGDYPAAIMVDGTGYLVSVNPLPAGTVDKAEITGCVDSYTGTFPEKDGQQNFSREAALPYAPAEGGLALLHDGAWYLCVPAQVDDDGVLLPGGDRP